MAGAFGLRGVLPARLHLEGGLQGDLLAARTHDLPLVASARTGELAVGSAVYVRSVRKTRVPLKQQTFCVRPRRSVLCEAATRCLSRARDCFERTRNGGKTLANAAISTIWEDEVVV
eukprot:6204471-Pleurochrysis_carterae.AAC.2